MIPSIMQSPRRRSLLRSRTNLAFKHIFSQNSDVKPFTGPLLFDRNPITIVHACIDQEVYCY
jgi:hypothetical protein